MAFAWADTFVAPNAISGFSSGAVTDIDEWPFSNSDTVVRSHTGSASHTNLQFDFDMSVGPGDKKGFWFWFKSQVSNASGIRIDSFRVIDAGGPTTLYTNSSPGITIIETTAGGAKIYVVEIPDSAFSGNPDIDDVRIEIDTTNLHTGNNNWTIHGVRLTKSPFTAAQEASLPASLAGQTFSCYRASDLVVLGAVDTEEITVWPDASGRGCHLVRITGTGRPLLDTGTPDTLEFDNATGARMIAYFGTRVTGNHIHHDYLRSDDTPGSSQAIWSHAEDFKGVVSTDKNILGTQNAGVAEWVLMSGDGTGPAHIGWGVYHTTLVRLTQWIRDSGNEKGWVNDDASPVVDAAGVSSSNDMIALSYGRRETDDRDWDGGAVEHWWIDGAGITEADIDDARDEWVNGPAGTLLYATGDHTGADVVNEADNTTNLYQSIDDDPDTPDDANWVNNVAKEVSKFFALTDMDALFGTADTLTGVVRAGGFNWTTGTLKLYARIYQSDESTALTNEILVGTFTANTALADIPITFTGVSAGNKTIWDAARIRFRWSET